MKTIIDYVPFLDMSKFWSERGRWPAKWISHPSATVSGAVVQAFRRTFSISAKQTIRIHVSADERYELYLDGQRIGRGPERGDRLHWRFETYDLPLEAGQHTLVARCWWLSEFAPSPYAQITVKPGFVVAAEVDDRALLNTGFAPWDAKILGGYKYISNYETASTGSRVHVTGKDFAWDYERGGGDGWVKPQTVDWAYDSNQLINQNASPALIPATLPAMIERNIHVGIARHVQALNQIPRGETVVQAIDHISSEVSAWDRLLAGSAPITIPANTIRRVIIDLENYYGAYTDLVTSGGAGSSIRAGWAESLFVPQTKETAGRERVKGNRDQIEGKTFRGIGDIFEPDGGKNRLFNTLWWEAGRYIELIVSTADEPLTIEQFSLRETHYPHEWTSQFEASDPRFADLTPITRRVLEMCSHETYMDCPYYEQMMYVGDSRLEVLTTYACTSDDRLPRKALGLFDDSRKPPGFTQSRYPARVEQTIPPFSAWWVGMLHDYAMWRDDPAFVRTLMPGMRSVLDTFIGFKTRDGFIAGPAGWNFMDWVPGWVFGIPPEGDVGGVSGPLNFQLAWIFKQAAELEEIFGEPELAKLHRRRSSEIAAAAVTGFWDESRGLFADDLKHTRFSEHTQCLALLGEVVDTTHRSQVIDHLFTDDKISRTTVYFSHYLFETCALTGRIAPMFDRLKLWFDLKGLGFKTTLESPEPSRSDCHAWGAHPMYHFYATILGIRPATPNFATVNIRPQLGPLQWARGTMVHPKGLIEVDLKQTDGRITGSVKLPKDVKGLLSCNGKDYPIETASIKI